jgi:hypothetical protein
MASRTDLAFLAGFFDGDGCARMKSGTMIEIGQVAKDKGILVDVEKKYGGWMYLKSAATETRQEFWKIDICGDDALRFARDVRPYILKSRKAAEIDAMLGNIAIEGSVKDFIELHREDDDEPVDLAGRNVDDLDAYFAGFAFADGCMSFQGRSPLINVKQKKPAVLYAMAEHFGVGTVSTDGPKCFQYCASADNAIAIAERLVPHMHDCGKREILEAFPVAWSMSFEDLEDLKAAHHGGRQSAHVRRALKLGHIANSMNKARTVHVGYQACFDDGGPEPSKSFTGPEYGSMANKLALAEEWLEKKRAAARAAAAAKGVVISPERFANVDEKARLKKEERRAEEIEGREEREAAAAAHLKRKADAEAAKPPPKKRASLVEKKPGEGSTGGFQARYDYPETYRKKHNLKPNSKNFTSAKKYGDMESKRIFAETWIVCEELMDFAEEEEKRIFGIA